MRIVPRRGRLAALAGVFYGLSLSAGLSAEPGATSGLPPQLATNLLQLRQQTFDPRSSACSVHLEGVVWWANAASGRIILHDSSGTEPLELDLPCQIPSSGERLRLEGDAVVSSAKDAIKLTSVPVVDNDGLHGMAEASGAVYLKPGRHLIQVAWFNGEFKYGLEVAYEGPGLPRQKIPDAVLLRPQIDPANGSTNLVNGLSYRCCEALGWSALPNLNHLPAVKTGTVHNFDLEARTRDEHVGLLFSGCIEIASEGLYTFYTTSDDGSQLFIGQPSLEVKDLGPAPLPPARHVAISQILPEGEPYLWCEMEGTVGSVNNNPGAQELELISETGRLQVQVAEDSDCSLAIAPHSRVRAVGVCQSIYTAEGHKVAGEFLVQNWKAFQVLYIAPELWAQYPLASVSNLMMNNRAGQEPIVHLRGKIDSTPQGPWLLEDGTGAIPLEGAQPSECVGYPVDVLAGCGGQSTNLVLRRGIYQRAAGTEQSAALPVLTTAEQVNSLSREELKRGYPVKLQGVITCAMTNGVVVIQGATRGICVARPDGSQDTLGQVGDYCEVEGTADPGEFSPYIRGSLIRVLGPGRFPDPVHPAWDQLVNGSLDCQYVELEGVITEVGKDRLTLLVRGGRIRVRQERLEEGLPEENLKSWENALVRMRGCLFADWSDPGAEAQPRAARVGHIRLDPHWVNVIEPAPADPFAVPAKRLSELLRFDPRAGALERVKISGQVVHQGATECFLMDGGSGLRFIPAKASAAQVSDLVEVVGFPDLTGPSPMLREAIVRRLGPAQPPKPHRLEPESLLNEAYDSTLVQMEGVLAGWTSKPEGDVLEMQSGLRRFTAVLEDKGEMRKPLAVGSRLELTGVYAGQGGNRVLDQPINSFQLLLGSPSDIRILARPPWWNLKRLSIMLGLLLVGLALALLWIKLLHSQVTERTMQLEAQIQERQRAERQRVIEQERSRIAQDLHDDLGAGLTEVNILGSLAKDSVTAPDEKAHYLAKMGDVTRRLVTSLDEIVWAINPQNDPIPSLASYFSFYARSFLEPASVRCGLDTADDLPGISIDSKARHDLFLALKEALTNVVRHARATQAWLRIRVDNNELIVAVTDNGCGLNSAKPSPGMDGLRGMQERMKALGGRCEIHSEPGKGTTVELKLPLGSRSP
jgi:signal transduction histidine kinase